MQALWLWCARLSWALLPLTAGAELTDALDEWSTAPATVATVLLWSAWVGGLVALLAPRPWGLTLLRVVAPAAMLTTIFAASATSAALAALAIASASIAAVLALSPPVARACANALAYGDEQRFPLRVPLPLLVAPVPVAVALVALGVVAGPLLLADGRLVLGGLAVLVGVPLAAFLARALHALSRRWLVFVPAGVVIVDPLTLMDPVLLRREQVRDISAGERGPRLDEALDLRLGSRAHSLTIGLQEAVTFGRRVGRVDGALVDADIVLVAPTRIPALLETARSRRIATG
jgi:hypothetical protein